MFGISRALATSPTIDAAAARDPRAPRRPDRPRADLDRLRADARGRTARSPTPGPPGPGPGGGRSAVDARGSSSGCPATSRPSGSGPTKGRSAGRRRIGHLPGPDRGRWRDARVAVGLARRRPTACPAGAPPGACRWPPTSSAWPSAGSGSPRRPRPPRSPAGATRSRAPCSTRSPTTCARRWRRSGRWPAACSTTACRSRPTAIRESAATIDEEALRLSEIVHGLLDLSRIEAGELKPNLALHELAELVETVVRRGRAGLGEHQLEVDRPGRPARSLVDALFFDQALTNVYENAIGPQPGRAPASGSGRAGSRRSRMSSSSSRTAARG